MSDSDTSTPPLALPGTTAARPAASVRRRFGWPWLAGFIALLLGAAYFWHPTTWLSGGEATANAEQAREQAQRDVLMHGLEQARHEIDTLRARLDDSTKVNQSLREQLLGYGERARLLEDAVANLADKRLSGHDALLLNEAEMLLALGNQRYTLFHDPAVAVDAYRFADSALAEVEDATFSTVRQSISAEVEALNATPVATLPALLGELAQLREGLAQLPAATFDAPPATEPPPSRWAQVFGQFVRVHHGEDTQNLLMRHDVILARSLAALDVREAEAALLTRDAARYADALKALRAELTAGFARGDTNVTAALASVDRLSKAVLVPAAPGILGTALKELRSLRATHALRAVPKPPAPVKPVGEGQS